MKRATTSKGALLIIILSALTISSGIFLSGCMAEGEPEQGSREESSDEVRIANLCNEDDYIKSSAASFSRKFPEYYVEYEEVTFDERDKRQTYRDRILAEITAGKGPDLLVLNGEDMKALNEKGVLADIAPMISDPVKEQLLPGSLKAGMVGEKLLGVTYRVSTETMYTSRDIWEEDTWTLEEFINLIEEKEKSGMQNMFAGVNNLSPYNLFHDLVMNNLQDSPFIDWEKAECNFDCELFYKVVAIVEKYGVEAVSGLDRDEETEKQLEALKNGEAIVYIASSVNSFEVFSRNMGSLGEKYFCIGYPADKTSESYWNSWTFLAVNKTAEENRAVKDYIDYFFDKEEQVQWGVASVRRDVCEESIQKKQSSGWDILPVKGDGTSYFEDYTRYLECCESITERRYEGILEIIDGEIKEYFAGKKGIEQVADAIQNRVQLYLWEEGGL